MMSSTMPSAKYSCSGSPLRLVNGSTATDGLSGKANGRVGSGGDGRRASRRDRRPDIAIAATRHGLDPICVAAGVVENPAQRRDLDRQITILDGQPRPGRLEQRVLGNRDACPLQKQPEQSYRALAQHDRLRPAEQDFRVRIEPERAEFVRRRHRSVAPLRKHFATFSDRFHDLSGRPDDDAEVPAREEAQTDGGYHECESGRPHARRG